MVGSQKLIFGHMIIYSQLHTNKYVPIAYLHVYMMLVQFELLNAIPFHSIAILVYYKRLPQAI